MAFVRDDRKIEEGLDRAFKRVVVGALIILFVGGLISALIVASLI